MRRDATARLGCLVCVGLAAITLVHVTILPSSRADETLTSAKRLQPSQNGAWAFQPLAQMDAALPRFKRRTASAMVGRKQIGVSVGGAKDAANFRENIKQGYVPRLTSVTSTGLFYDYTFASNSTLASANVSACEGVTFCPGFITASSRDPLSSRYQQYLSVRLDSGITDFRRPRLEVVFVIDVSGSMSGAFDEYHYDVVASVLSRGRARADERPNAKVRLLPAVVKHLIANLDDDDSFAIVQFHTSASMLAPRRTKREHQAEMSKNDGFFTAASSPRYVQALDSLQARGGTDLAAGLQAGYDQFDRSKQAPVGVERRMFVLTDAMPNSGEFRFGETARHMATSASVHMTFVGIGVDFNADLAEELATVPGFNYLSSRNQTDVVMRLGRDFDFLVSPLASNVSLRFESNDLCVVRKFGVPQGDDERPCTAHDPTTNILSLPNLFAAAKEEESGAIRGGVILLEVARRNVTSTVAQARRSCLARIVASYRQGGRSNGELITVNAVMCLQVDETCDCGATPTAPEASAADGVWKAIALSRYVTLMRDWIRRSGRSASGGTLGVYEQHSVPLKGSVSLETSRKIAVFERWFLKEAERVAEPLMKSLEGPVLASLRSTVLPE
jgi:Ca-activated chloride channel family protein